MARTNRDKLNARRREHINTWVWTPETMHECFDYSDPLNRYPRLRGGNMVMSPSVSGIWDDERPISGKGRERDAQRRHQKRRERQAWRAAALDELAERE